MLLYLKSHKNSGYTITLDREEDIMKIFYGIKLIDQDGVLHDLRDQVNSELIEQYCCRRAFTRGAFLCIGSMSDPMKGYHLELVCTKKQHDLYLP